METALGLTLKDNLWAQTTLPTRAEGLGLQEAREVSDAPYMVSRGMAKNMDPERVCDGKDRMSELGQAFGGVGLGSTERGTNQKRILEALSKTEMQKVGGGGGPRDEARLLAVTTMPGQRRHPGPWNC